MPPDKPAAKKVTGIVFCEPGITVPLVAAVFNQNTPPFPLYNKAFAINWAPFVDDSHPDQVPIASLDTGYMPKSTRLEPFIVFVTTKGAPVV